MSSYLGINLVSVIFVESQWDSSRVVWIGRRWARSTDIDWDWLRLVKVVCNWLMLVDVGSDWRRLILVNWGWQILVEIEIETHWGQLGSSRIEWYRWIRLGVNQLWFGSMEVHGGWSKLTKEEWKRLRLIEVAWDRLVDWTWPRLIGIVWDWMGSSEIG